MLHGINGILLSNNPPQRFWSVKNSYFVKKLRHGLHLCLSIFKTSLQLIKSILVGGALCGLMLCECAGGPMAAASKQETTEGEAAALPTAPSADAEGNAGKSNHNSTPSRNAFDLFKTFFSHKCVT